MTNSKFNIKPITPISSYSPKHIKNAKYGLHKVALVTGMSEYFIKKVTGKKADLNSDDVALLLEQDAFAETFIPRSKIFDYLEKDHIREFKKDNLKNQFIYNGLHHGDSKELIQRIPDGLVQCVVTSSPYWAMRIYDDMKPTVWADGDNCPYGLEQTPEGFIRHTIEILAELYPKIAESGSIWWNIMDTFNTRTQIRENASEALRAMQGLDEKSWSDHSYKRYSAGHSYLKDGEQCLIPQKIAERASRIGYYVKSIISWGKSSSLPEPQNSRVSRNIEYVIHLAKIRTPYFDKEPFRTLPPELGGRQPLESDKLSDSWYLPTSAGRDGHGAQFPIELPSRCIAISTRLGDVVLDPFIGSGTTAQACELLNRRCIGFDISETYISLAQKRVTQIAR